MINTVAGITYRILIESETNVALLDLTVFEPPLELNDFCNNSFPLAVGSTIYVNTTNATGDDLDAPYICDNWLYRGYYPGVWYSFMGTGERLVLRSCGFPDDSYENYRYFYVLEGGCNSSNILCRSSASKLCDRERVVVDSTQGTMYHLLLLLQKDLPLDLSIFAVPLVVNDFCANALPIEIGTNVTANTTYATSDLEEVDIPRFCIGDSLDVPGVWYMFEGTGDRLVLQSCDALGNVTYISVYEGKCGATNLQCVGGTNVGCHRPYLMIDSKEGVLYHVLIKSKAEMLDLSIFPVPADVSNDRCKEAFPIGIGSTVNVNATFANPLDLDESNGCYQYFFDVFPGVWYTFNGTGERLGVKSCIISLGYTQYIAILQGSCNSKDLKCVTNSAQKNLCNSTELLFDTKQGETYYILFYADYDMIYDLSLFVAGAPDVSPSKSPTYSPSTYPSKIPSTLPSMSPPPDHSPSKSPSYLPTRDTSSSPTRHPIAAPLEKPTDVPNKPTTDIPSKPTTPPVAKKCTKAKKCTGPKKQKHQFKQMLRPFKQMHMVQMQRPNQKRHTFDYKLGWEPMNLFRPRTKHMTFDDEKTSPKESRSTTRRMKAINT